MKRGIPTSSRAAAKRARYREYPVRRILEENESQYKIDWKPDERTGEVYDPTWEYKDDVSFDLRLDWTLENLATHVPKQCEILSESKNGRFLVRFETAWMDEDQVDRSLLDGWRLKYVPACPEYSLA